MSSHRTLCNSPLSRRRRTPPLTGNPRRRPSTRLLQWICVVALLAVGGADHAAAQVWEVDNLLLVGSSPGSSAYGASIAAGDFDGDGDLDLAVGEPNAPSSLSANHGKVYIYRNDGARQLTFWHSTGPDGQAQQFLGFALTAGDFDADGRDELAIGTPGRNIGSSPVSGAGAVEILSWTGVSWIVDTTLSQASTPSLAVPEISDSFGWMLLAADFDDDQIDDLAVTVLGEDFGATNNMGVVQIFYGAVWGFDLGRSQLFAPGFGGVVGSPSHGERFGYSLGAADFNGNGYSDLAIGAPGRRLAATDYAGQVHVLRGSASGLTTTGQLLFSESSFGTESVNEEEWFGESLAAGELDQSLPLCLIITCYADLAIGAPGKIVAGKADAGKVLVAYGTATGFDTAAGTYTNLSQQSVAAAVVEEGDLFGRSLAIGPLNGGRTLFDTFEALAVSAPSEAIGGGVAYEGFVQLFFGSDGGVDSGQQEQAFGQEAGFRIAPPVAGDRFGTVLVVADLDGDAFGDLIVGTPNKTIGGVSNKGAVQILFGGLFADGFESGGTGHWSVSLP